MKKPKITHLRYIFISEVIHLKPLRYWIIIVNDHIEQFSLIIQFQYFLFLLGCLKNTKELKRKDSCFRTKLLLIYSVLTIMPWSQHLFLQAELRFALTQLCELKVRLILCIFSRSISVHQIQPTPFLVIVKRTKMLRSLYINESYFRSCLGTIKLF